MHTQVSGKYPSVLHSLYLLIFSLHRDYKSTRRFTLTLDMLVRTFSLLDLVNLQKITQINQEWDDIGTRLLCNRVFFELELHIRPTPDMAVHDDARRKVITEFLALLSETRSVVSGSTALSVCMHHTERAGEWMSTRALDVFTPIHALDVVVRHFVDVLGYDIVETLSS